MKIECFINKKNVDCVGSAIYFMQSFNGSKLVHQNK